MTGTKTRRFAAGGLDNELEEAVFFNKLLSTLCVFVFILLKNMTLKLKFLIGCLYVVLNTTFIITSEVTLVTFKTGRSIHGLSFKSYILFVYLSFVNFILFLMVNVSQQVMHSCNFPSRVGADTALVQ